MSEGSRIARFLDRWLTHRRLPLLLAVLAAALTLPSLWGGWVVDDHHHRLWMGDYPDFPSPSDSPWDLFVFANGDPARTREMMDLGVWPWWTLPEIRAAFFRPVTVLTHRLDYTLWPQLPSLMHAQSVLWFAGLVAAVTLLYRRFLGLTLVAGVAALFYAIDDARGMPVGFLANRNAVIAAFFGMLCILAHDRWRREGWRAGGLIAPVLLLVSLLSAEGGIGTIAYLFAHAVFLDRASWRRRLAVLLPYAVVVVGWRLAWTQLGYGVWGLGLYVDPLAEPLLYLRGLLDRIPVLLLGQFLLPPAEVYLFCLDFKVVTFYPLIAGAVVLAIGFVMIPRLPWDATTRFWCLGMALSLLPICATFPADRMLFFVGLGAFALVGQFFEAVFSTTKPATVPGGQMSKRRMTKALGCALVAVHGLLAPIVLSVRTAIPIGPHSLLESLRVNAPMDHSVEEQSVVVVAAPMPFYASWLPEQRTLAGLPVPAHTRVLAPSNPPPVEVRRLDKYTLAVRPGRGFMAMIGDQLPRAPHLPMAIGERVELTGMTAEVISLTEDNRPFEVKFTFSVPLEDESLRWFTWGKRGFVPFAPPPVGDKIILPVGTPSP
ncbi:MAG: hypothetical protein JSU63_17835 [Phycisphaerales bacterium]|nr:MAG: hypothetical protein JSU63_17835 [Phycisphaerales bacterium]